MSSESTPKHFVFVPGSFHASWCWYKMQPLLNNKGNTSISIDLPAHGWDSTPISEVTLDSYVNVVCREPNAPVGTPLQLSPERYGAVQKVYIHTTLDNTISYEAQLHMVKRLPVHRTFTLQAGHSPFFSQPKELADILLSL